jgi:protease-4
MGKFLLGLITGAILIVLIGVIGFFAIASLKSKPATVADGSTLFLRLSGEVPEKPAMDIPIPLLQSETPLTVEAIWSLLDRAAADSRIKAIVFEPEGVTLGWAKMQEIHDDLEKFRKSGKPVYAYLKSPGTREYYLATAASKIYMSPVDTLNLKGLGLELMYFKNTLDKLGVQVDVEHAGKYKDYGDMFTKTSMSPETKEVMNSIVDDVYGDLVNTIAKGRGKDAATVRAIIDDGPFLSTQAKAKELVDALRYEDEMLGDLKGALHQTELKKLSAHDYAGVPDSSVTSSDRIAFVVGEGSITRGSADSSGDNGLESEAFDKTLEHVKNDSGIKAVIVRIDSPGGEVTASDDMWRAMNQLSRKKPVVISMSDAAASGGYYMAMSGDQIVAYPGTETGSIGVVFGKPNLHGLYDKIGITKDSVSRGRFALIDSDYRSLDDAGRAKLRQGIDADYQDFVAKVATARHKTPADIEPIAQGRVWMGDQAKANGLVDELGGIDKAVQMARLKAKLPMSAKLNIEVYPGKRSIFDFLFKSGGDSDADALMSNALLSRSGLEPLRAAWRDDRLRVWMRGGMLRMMPFSLEFR